MIGRKRIKTLARPPSCRALLRLALPLLLCASARAAHEPAGWQLVWSDEFNQPGALRSGD